MRVRIVVLFFLWILISSLILAQSTGPATDNNQDQEIQRLKQEITRLKQILVALIRVLPQEEKDKFADTLAQLEKELSDRTGVTTIEEGKPVKELKKEKEDGLDKLRVSVDKIKEDVKRLSGGIAFSGFFDVSVSTYRNYSNMFNLGDFEFDMEKSFGKNFQVAAALVFGEDGARMGVGFIDFHIFGGSVPARGRIFSDKGFHLQIGQFDVPFGNDWQYVASRDRISFTAPLSTQLIMDGGYNDVGLRIIRSGITYNYTLYILKGVEEGIAYGGRVGLTPFSNPFTLHRREAQHLEMGISYLRDMDRDGKTELKAYSVDLESKIGPFQLQAEYIVKKDERVQVKYKGMQYLVSVDLSRFSTLPFTVFSRYDNIRDKNYLSSGKEKLDRIAGGININLRNIAIIKSEFLHFFKGNELFSGSSFYIQLVIIF